MHNEMKNTKEKFVKYLLETGDLLLYNKKSKETFVVDGNLPADLLQRKIEELEEQGNRKSIFFWGVSFYNLERIFKNRKIITVIDWLLVYMSLPLFILGVYINLEEIKKILLSPLNFGGDMIIQVILLAILVFVVSLLLHEIGHTIIAISRRAYVPEIGIGIKNGKFLAYTKILQMEQLKKKKDRICIYLGGIFVNIFILSIALIINALLLNHILFKVIACVNLFIALFNFSIYFNSDGADILKCLLKSEEDTNNIQFNAKYVVIFSAILLNVILPAIAVIFSIIYQ